MLKNMRLFIIGNLSVILILLIVINCQGQTQTENLLDKKINLTIKAGNLFQVCAGLTTDGIPLGFESATDFDINGDKNIKIKDGTLKEILDSIVKQEPNYKWEFQDGVINLYPVRSRDNFLKSLLETRIINFSSKKEAGRAQIAENINGLAEINTLLNSKQLRLNISTKTNLYRKDAITDVNLSNTDLKGILNKIVHDSEDNKFWTISRTTDGGVWLVF